MAEENKEKRREFLNEAQKYVEAVLEFDNSEGRAYYCRSLLRKAEGENDSAEEDLAKARQLGFDKDEESLFACEINFDDALIFELE